MPLSTRRLTTAILLAGLGLIAFAIDLPAALWFQSGSLPKEVMRYLTFTEVFGHGTGVAVIMIGVFCLDRSLRFPSLTWPALRWPTFQPTPARRHAARMLGGLLAGVGDQVGGRICIGAALGIGVIWAAAVVTTAVAGGLLALEERPAHQSGDGEQSPG